MIYRCPVCRWRCDVYSGKVYCPYCGLDHGSVEDNEALAVFESDAERLFHEGCAEAVQ